MAHRLYGIGLGVDFGHAFAQGLRARYTDNPPDLADALVVVNSVRFKSRLTHVFNTLPQGFIPRIVAFDELADHVLPWRQPIDPESFATRILTLVALIRELSRSESIAISDTQIFDLAHSLDRVLDEFVEYGIEPDAIDNLEVEDVAEHWQVNAKFINIVWQYVKSLGEAGRNLPADARRESIQAVIDAWTNHPPAGKIYIAGSTGSRPAMRELIAFIGEAGLGETVLPGVDFSTLAEDTPLTQDHPQFGLRDLSTALDAEIVPWVDTENSPRATLLTNALTPAPATDRWVANQALLGGIVRDATADIIRLETQTQREEADAIALLAADAVAADMDVAIVSADRNLTRRISVNLAEMDILTDDSGGEPARLSSAGLFIDLILSQAISPKKIELLKLLQHPFTQSAGKDRREQHRENIRRFEQYFLRRKGGAALWQRLQKAIDEDKRNAPAADWLERLNTAREKIEAGGDGRRSLAAWSAWLVETAKALIGSDDFDDLPGRDQGDIALFDFIAGFAREEGAAMEMSLNDFRQFWALFIEEKPVHKRGEPEASVRILGTIEARTETADLVVLAGLNEGVWPGQPGDDIWLNRQSRKALGLPTPERRTGLMAHDFISAATQGRVVLSRAVRQGDAMTIASRWVTRFDTLVTGLGVAGREALDAMQMRGAGFVMRARALRKPQHLVTPEPRPEPNPSVDIRPRVQNVTDFDRMGANPYGYYVQAILGIEALDPIQDGLDPRQKGELYHRFFETLVPQLQPWPDEPETIYRTHIAGFLAEQAIEAGEALDLELRLSGIETQFLLEEAARQQRASNSLTEKGVSFEMTVDDVTRKIKGKIDRIDVGKAGETYLYDYKSGTSAPFKNKSIDISQAPQFGIEALAMEAGRVNGVGKGAPHGIEVIRYNDGSALAFKDMDIAAFREDFETMIRHVLQSETPLFATVPRQERSPYSDEFAHIARYGEWLGDRDET